MPDGSSSAAPVITPGPSARQNRSRARTSSMPRDAIDFFRGSRVTVGTQWANPGSKCRGCLRRDDDFDRARILHPSGILYPVLEATMAHKFGTGIAPCLLYTSDAADE